MRGSGRNRLGDRVRRVLVPALGSLVIESVGTWVRSHRVGGNLVVRCRQGHLFTTIWIPGASIKSLRLGWWRVQYCPIGRHWSLVTPVRAAELTERERRFASKHHDVRVP